MTPSFFEIAPTPEQWRKAMDIYKVNFAAEIENEARAIAMREHRPRTDDKDVAANPLLHVQV
jgi:hypothetical protein